MPSESFRLATSVCMWLIWLHDKYLMGHVRVSVRVGTKYVFWRSRKGFGLELFFVCTKRIVSKVHWKLLGCTSTCVHTILFFL